MNIRNRNILDTDKIGRLLARLSVPIFFGQLVLNIYNVVDMIFIGNYVGTNGIAALSVVMPIQTLLVGVGNMIGIGGGSLISRLIGSGDRAAADKALGNSLFFTLLCSVVMTAVILPSLNYWLTLIGASPAVLPLATNYLVIIFATAVISVGYIVLLTIIRAEGNTRVMMIAMIAQALLNIGFDALFIVSLEMGIQGAALATVLSQGIALLYLLIYYVSGKGYLKIRWKDFLPVMNIVKGIFSIGLTQFAQTATSTVAMVFFVRQVANYGGDIALGAFGIVQRVMMFSSMPSQVLGQAMQPILGFNYGAKRYKMALKSITLSYGAALVMGIVALVILELWPEPIARIFNSDPALINESIIAMRFTFSMAPFFSLFNVGYLVFPATGKVWESFITALMRPGIMLIILVLVLPPFFQLNGVWCAFPGCDVFGFLLVLGFTIPLLVKFRKDTAAPQS